MLELERALAADSVAAVLLIQSLTALAFKKALALGDEQFPEKLGDTDDALVVKDELFPADPTFPPLELAEFDTIAAGLSVASASCSQRCNNGFNLHIFLKLKLSASNLFKFQTKSYVENIDLYLMFEKKIEITKKAMQSKCQTFKAF